MVEELGSEIEVTEGGARGAFWQAEYMNPETLSSFLFTCKPPKETIVNFCAREVGLGASIPNPSATFVAREAIQILSEFACKNKLIVYTQGGEMIENPDPSQIQILWNNSCKKILQRLSVTGAEMPSYFSMEQLDAMCRYAHARPQLVKRYDGRGINVPRVVLIRNKLARNQVLRSIIWSEMEPIVYPEVDAVVISRPAKLIFGRFPAGDTENVVVRVSTIAEIIKPCIRTAPRPFEHQLIEDASSVRLPVLKRIMELLPARYRMFETVNPDEVVDIKV